MKKTILQPQKSKADIIRKKLLSCLRHLFEKKPNSEYCQGSKWITATDFGAQPITYREY